MSGQCTPNPLPTNSKLLRWAGVASDKRHDQAKGTLMTRPSARCATIESSVICSSMLGDDARSPGSTLAGEGQAGTGRGLAPNQDALDLKSRLMASWVRS